MLQLHISKQKLLQVIVFAVAGCGIVVEFIQDITSILPPHWQHVGLLVIGIAVATEKALISTNQILVGPTKLQSPVVQDELRAMPAKSAADSSTDPIKVISSIPPQVHITPAIPVTPKTIPPK